ncbi:ABC transporter ATP-binding protein [Rhodococcus opacus]|uniref:ABC transporter ATP-binding protein n=1 Tax=Rhodococcus opacus TaxID=37919 RepID=UPI001C461752|nr:ABC transporter ATP-binding protein [Rhodococcus opacus]MBV6759072.1 ABC transporter ATP-binding protein [Rhodococcus opacus]
MSSDTVLELRDLTIGFKTGTSVVEAVRCINLTLARGEICALIGESGSGKSATAQAVIGSSPDYATVSGTILLNGAPIQSLSKRERRRLAGESIAMVSQDALRALNPCTTVGFQVAEVLMTRRNMKRQAAFDRAAELLDRVGIPDPGRRISQYPHQFSGGMQQRVLIAMSLALNPRLLVADEPTTALDVTVKVQILELLQTLRDQFEMSVLIITHDMGVVARIGERVAVMDHGEFVETGDVIDVFSDPQHAKTKQLIAAIPRIPTTVGGFTHANR